MKQPSVVTKGSKTIPSYGSAPSLFSQNLSVIDTYLKASAAPIASAGSAPVTLASAGSAPVTLVAEAGRNPVSDVEDSGDLSDLFATWCGEQEGDEAVDSNKRRRVVAPFAASVVAPPPPPPPALVAKEDELLVQLLSSDTDGALWDDVAFFAENRALFSSVEQLDCFDPNVSLSHAYFHIY